MLGALASQLDGGLRIKRTCRIRTLERGGADDVEHGTGRDKARDKALAGSRLSKAHSYKDDDNKEDEDARQDDLSQPILDITLGKRGTADEGGKILR